METVKVDSAKRVRLPDAKPGQVLAYEMSGNTFTLTPVRPVEPTPIKGRLEKHGKRLLGVTNRPITSAMVKQALADFP